MAKTPVVLIIMDGLGLRKEKRGNAPKCAKAPVLKRLMKEHPMSRLSASGRDVGLPSGFIGNSEVGHLNIGSGRIVKEMIAKIDDSIKDGSFFSNKSFLKMIQNCKKHNSTLHLIGLIQMEGVHSMSTHLIALLRLCRKNEFYNVVIHAFTDGRDSPPKSAERQMKIVKDAIKRYHVGRFVTLTGRYYAMDRDKRWERTRVAYECIMNARGENSETIDAAIKDAYRKGESDEFIKPRVIDGYAGIRDNDSIIIFNYRLDRARQLTQSIVDPKFREFPKRMPKGLKFCSMTEYYKELGRHSNVSIAFPRKGMKNILGEVLSKKGRLQFRCAETEKFAHVTYFFNGQNEKPFRGEDRVLIPSPKVATYDLQPEMSAEKVKGKVCEAIRSKRYDFLAVNFANPDMVGHTGIMAAAVKAVEKVDSCVGSVLVALKKAKGAALIISDHGNCEEMIGIHKTSHTTNKVPCIFVDYRGRPLTDPDTGKNGKAGSGSDRSSIKIKDGKLADVAPTILDIMHIKKPREMTGKSLISRT